MGVPGDGRGSRRGWSLGQLMKGWSQGSRSLPYPSCAAEEQEDEGDYHEDAPAGHCCMRFELVYVLGGAMCKGSPWGVRVVAGAECGA